MDRRNTLKGMGAFAAVAALRGTASNNDGWKGVKEKGLMRQEGKEYVVKDGDVMLFRFNV